MTEGCHRVTRGDSGQVELKGRRPLSHGWETPGVKGFKKQDRVVHDSSRDLETKA